MSELEKIHMPSYARGSATGFDPMALPRLKADCYNREQGSLTGYRCKKCLDRGHIAVVREDASLAFQQCSCMNIRRCTWKMEKSGLRNVISRYPFDSFTTAQDWQKGIKDKAMAYAQEPKGWFAMCGQSGSGKTHLCVAICRELLLQGKQVVYMPWVSDVAELKRMDDAEARAERMNDLKSCEVLYIDDLFKSGNSENNWPTGADVRIAFEILNQRYLDGPPTVISTEMLPEVLMRVDEAVAGRILEIAKGFTFSIAADTKKNYRLQGLELS